MMENRVPRHCVWETTLRCNLDCLHCGSRAGESRGAELGTDEAFKLIDDLKGLGCERMILSGGEPLLREDLAELVRHIKDRGLRPCLISNGLILPQKIGLLESLPLYSVGISLDGLEDTHNHLRRNQESFMQAVESLRLLSEMFVDVYVISQINRLNFSDLEGLHGLIAGLDVDGWQIQLTSGMGRAEELDIMLSREQVGRLQDFIIGKRKGALKVYAGDDIGYYRHDDFEFTGCRGGISVVGIEADGGVKPCLSMQKDGRFAGGNIRRRPLKEIWHDPGFAAVNRNERELAGRCAACGRKSVCRGGCVGTAAACGSLEEYPFCETTR